MPSPETIESLRSHAGLTAPNPDGAYVSDAVLLGRRVRDAVNAFIGALQMLNIEINGLCHPPRRRAAFAYCPLTSSTQSQR